MARRKPALKGKKGEPEYFKYIRSRITEVWGWSPERKKAKERARIPASNIALESYRCELCGDQPLTRSQIEIDHIICREGLQGWQEDGEWNGLISRTFCPAEGLQVICKPCHHKKSAIENAERRKNKKRKSNEEA